MRERPYILLLVPLVRKFHHACDSCCFIIRSAGTDRPAIGRDDFSKAVAKLADDVHSTADAMEDAVNEVAEVVVRALHQHRPVASDGGFRACSSNESKCRVAKGPTFLAPATSARTACCRNRDRVDC